MKKQTALLFASAALLLTGCSAELPDGGQPSTTSTSGSSPTSSESTDTEVSTETTLESLTTDEICAEITAGGNDSLIYRVLHNTWDVQNAMQLDQKHYDEALAQTNQIDELVAVAPSEQRSLLDDLSYGPNALIQAVTADDGSLIPQAQRVNASVIETAEQCLPENEYNSEVFSPGI